MRFPSLQSVPVVTAESSEADVVAALRSDNVYQVEVAAKLMADQCTWVEPRAYKGEDALRLAYADACGDVAALVAAMARGAVAALVAAMATHGARSGAQIQLCRAIAAYVRRHRVRQCVVVVIHRECFLFEFGSTLLKISM